ncbi:hypothetical protein Ciccas_009999 [Cichlidogyrus casuarinus]|uniref:Uncharacterized protein n=1 Tax=Cichlidogyrus casuarinus TaxID=1844966 RepID=A0ABD2PVN3_9PLAT
MVTESWLTSRTPSELINVPGYTTLRLDRNHSLDKVFCNSSLNPSTLRSASEPHLETLTFQIEPSASCKVIFSCLYRPSSDPLTDPTFAKLLTSLQNIEDLHSHFSPAGVLCHLLAQDHCGWSQLINGPTHSNGASLDVLFIRNLVNPLPVQILRDKLPSDHFVILTNVALSFDPTTHDSGPEFLLPCRVDFHVAREILTEFIRDNSILYNVSHHTILSFLQLLSGTIQNLVQVCTRPPTTPNPAKQSYLAKLSLEFRSRPSLDCLIKLKQLSLDLADANNRRMTARELKLVRRFRQDPRPLFKLLESRRNAQQSSIPSLTFDGLSVSSDLDKAELLAQHFQKNFTIPSSPQAQVELPPSNLTKLKLPVFSECDIRAALKHCRSQATGSDRINYRALKLLDPLHPFLADLRSVWFIFRNTIPFGMFSCFECQVHVTFLGLAIEIHRFPGAAFSESPLNFLRGLKTPSREFTSCFFADKLLLAIATKVSVRALKAYCDLVLKQILVARPMIPTTKTCSTWKNDLLVS